MLKCLSQLARQSTDRQGASRWFLTFDLSIPAIEPSHGHFVIDQTIAEPAGMSCDISVTIPLGRKHRDQDGRCWTPDFESLPFQSVQLHAYLFTAMETDLDKK